MYRSKEKLLESVDETESVLSTYRSRLRGLTNRSFDYTTESSVHSTENFAGGGTKIQVENVEVYRTGTDSIGKPPIPVPLPRSKIPKPSSAVTVPAKHSKVKAKRREVDPEDAIIEREPSTASSIPLTTFVVNETKRGKHKSKRSVNLRESSATITSTEELSSTTTTLDNKRDESSAASAEKKIKKRRRKKTNLERAKSHDDEDTEEKDTPGTESFIGFYVHDLEFLRFTPDLESVHIRVSCYDQSNGHLLSKLRKTKDETPPGDIPPLVSKRCRFEHVNYLHCIWEELLLIEDECDRVLRTENSIIFFEIIATLESSIDFQTLAWAFLKPFHANQYDNFDKRSVLQVYHYNPKMNLFQNWRNTKRHRKYPSTLSVTLKSITPLMHNEAETGTGKDVDGKRVDDVPTDPFDVSALWTSRNFKCPNQVVSAQKLSGRGTNLVKINPQGTVVAIANPIEDGGASQIVICTVPELKVVQKLDGHSGFIYGMEWGRGGKYPQTLISCSADQTALIWTIDKSFNYTVQVLPHVTFIYCCAFWDGEIILTGGKDSIIRVWSPFRNSFKIHQELSKGAGFVTCIAVVKSSMFYSGDSDGRVVEWKWTKDAFEFSRIIYQDQTMISHIEMHPRIGSLYIGNRRGFIVSVDVETKIVIQRFEKGHQELRRFFKFRISNCGMYLITTGDGQNLDCWNILTQVEVELLRDRSRSVGLVSSIDLPRKGSFVIIGRYQTNKDAVVLINNSSISPQVREPFSNGEIAHYKETTEQTKAVKNKLSEIIEKIDQVFVLPRLCDDEKISLSQDMVNEKKRIEEWLDQNVATTPRSPSAGSDQDDGTFVVERPSSVKSNGTFTVEKEVGKEERVAPAKPRRRMFVKQAKQEDDLEVEDEKQIGTDDKSVASGGGTYEIKKKRDTDADDTSVSDSVFAA